MLAPAYCLLVCVRSLMRNSKTSNMIRLQTAVSRLNDKGIKNGGTNERFTTLVLSALQRGSANIVEDNQMQHCICQDPVCKRTLR